MQELKSLIEAARLGDMKAYGTIVQRFADMAYGYAYAILGDFHLAEDAAQEAFVEAYYNLARLREAAAFPGWLRRIVLHVLRRTGPRSQPPHAGLVPRVPGDGAARGDEPLGRPGHDATVRAVRRTLAGV